MRLNLRAAQRDAAQNAAVVLEKSLGVKIEFADHAFGSHSYSAGTTEQRQQDLMAAFADPEVKAIVLSMGGATAIDVIDGLDYDLIVANPKIVTGISDSSTVLEAITARTGLVTFHGFEMLDFDRYDMPYTTDSMRQVWFEGWSGAYQPNPHWHDLEGERTTYRHWPDSGDLPAAETASTRPHGIAAPERRPRRDQRNGPRLLSRFCDHDGPESSCFAV